MKNWPKISVEGPGGVFKRREKGRESKSSGKPSNIRSLRSKRGSQEIEVFEALSCTPRKLCVICACLTMCSKNQCATEYIPFINRLKSYFLDRNVILPTGNLRKDPCIRGMHA